MGITLSPWMMVFLILMTGFAGFVDSAAGGGDACFTQFGAFVGNGYSKVIYMMLLQCFGNLV